MATRSAIADLKRMADGTPIVGIAFRAMADQIADGKLRPGDLAAELRKLYGPKEG
jgi:hypothetical protein